MNNNKPDVLLEKGPNVVAIGGGTGLSILLRGLKKYTANITAIVTVADDGGGSGKLREDLGMLPPGDIRNCIIALANTEPMMERLLQYRFPEGSLKGQCFGNLLIAAMLGISENFVDAIKKVNDILAVTGKVLPVTTEDVVLYGELKNGMVIKGESQLPIQSKKYNSPIERIYLEPRGAKPLKESIDAILDSDIIIMGPGSLFTSVMPNLVIEEITEAIKKSQAIKVYVANLMSQPGETDNYTAGDHLKAIINHTKGNIVDYIYVNSGEIPMEVLDKYRMEGSHPVKVTDEDEEYFEKIGIKLITNDYLDIKMGYLRHDAEKLARDILVNSINEKYKGDMEKIMEFTRLIKE